MPKWLAVADRLAALATRQRATLAGSALSGRPRLVLPRCVRPVAASDCFATSSPARVRARMASRSISAICASTARIRSPAPDVIEPSPHTITSTPLSMSARTVAWMSRASRPSRSMADTCSLSPSRTYPSIAEKPGRLLAKTEPLTPWSSNSLSKGRPIGPASAPRCAAIVWPPVDTR